jgi:predicted AlkP superfamily phosphohydrolase/phosphomutase
MGTYVYYVDDLEVAKRNAGSTHGTEMGGRVIEVIREGNDMEAFLPGPWHPIRGDEEITAPLEMTVDPSSRTLEFRILNRTPFRFLVFFGGAIISLIAAIILWAILARVLRGNARGFGTAFVIFLLALVVLWAISRPTQATEVVPVAEGEWSEWVPVKYLVTDWVGIEGFFRLYFIEAEPEFQLYVTPVSIDPRGTATALSFPDEYAPALLNRYGYFKTYGWDSETWALNENVIDEDVFLNDLLENWDLKANMVLEQMKRDDWTIFSAVFQGTDHTSHMFWRFLDPEHPMYDAAMAEKYGDTILTVYQRADTLVGHVLDEILGEDDELIVMSDHGFNSFRRAVNLNRWLVDNGYLAEKKSVLGSVLGGGEESSVYELFTPGSQFFGWVDWSRSKAYALGLGQIYVNLEGRESKGIVTEDERSDLVDEIIEGMREMRDPETGDRVLVDVYRGDVLYHGDNMEYAPDIVVGFAPGYRVSWQTCLGVAAEHLVELNERKWSGDHCSFDPHHTLGILFSTAPITVDDPCLIDLTPSVLHLVGVEKPSRCDGRVIF